MDERSYGIVSNVWLQNWRVWSSCKRHGLLNFLQGSQEQKTEPGYRLEFVVDDAPLKQNTFTPGTGIPVVTGSTLRTLAQEFQTNGGSGLALIIFAWNFFDEISRVVAQLSEIAGLNDILYVFFHFHNQKLCALRSTAA